jgi:hypothetical protein
MTHKDNDLEKLQYAEFTRSFDEGFRQLTFFMLGERYSPWEALCKEKDNNSLMDHLKT